MTDCNCTAKIRNSYYHDRMCAIELVYRKKERELRAKQRHRIALKLAEELYNFQNRWKCKVGWYRPWNEVRPDTIERWVKLAKGVMSRIGI